MPRSVTFRLAGLRRRALVATFAASLATTGCLGSEVTPVVPRLEGAITVVDVSDDAFAVELQRILRDGKSTAPRLGLLVGVVRRQLAHAERRFASGQDARATQSVMGALYLVRAGESRGEMVDPIGEKALAGAIARISARGDEGRAHVLMKMRAAFLPPGSPARVDVESHLATLEQWMQDSRSGTVLQKLAAAQRAAVARAMVDPSDEAVEAAVIAITAWVKRSTEYIAELERTGRSPDREETLEALRALSWGGATMAVVFLRHGNAKGALEALDHTGVSQASSALPDEMQQPFLDFHPRLRGAARGDGSSDWLGLAATFAHQVPERRRLQLDPELITAGLWGSALEGYRRDPKNLSSALLLARTLVHFGMPEAAPLALAEALEAHPSPRAASAAMDLVLSAVADSAEVDDIETARRTFKAAAGVLTLAANPALGPVEPSPSRARFAMASIEVRAGNLAAARPLLHAAIKGEPSVAGFTTLAVVERQAGSAPDALAAVEQALRAPDARVALLDVADAHIVAFEIYRDGSEQARAKGSLDAALDATLNARKLRGNKPTQARAERLLGRILEGYGDAKGASRAFERALQLAATDRPAFGAAMLDVIGRALVRRDLGAARAVLKRGLDGGVSEEDLVYGSLWVSLLERDLKVPPDGTVERALRTGTHSPWTGKLTAWVNGKISDSDLNTAAQNPSQRVEAAFYTAMARKAAGDPSANQRLRAVATSPVIDLLEVRIARDIVAPAVRPDLPGGVQLP